MSTMIVIWIVGGAVIVGVFALAAFWKPKAATVSASDETAGDDVYSAAALDLSRVDQGSIVFGYSPEQAERATKRIDEYEAWANALEDPRWRRAHLGWVKFSRKRIAESVAIYDRTQHINALRQAGPKP